jgi:hypothetical protein
LTIVTSLIHPKKKIARPQDVENFFVHRDVRCYPLAKAHRKRLQWQTLLEHLVTPSGLQHQACHDYHRPGHEKAKPGLHRHSAVEFMQVVLFTPKVPAAAI